MSEIEFEAESVTVLTFHDNADTRPHARSPEATLPTKYHNKDTCICIFLQGHRDNGPVHAQSSYDIHRAANRKRTSFSQNVTWKRARPEVPTETRITSFQEEKDRRTRYWSYMKHALKGKEKMPMRFMKFGGHCGFWERDFLGCQDPSLYNTQATAG